MKTAKKGITILLKTGLVVAAALPQVPTNAAVPSSAQFGPSNPVYAPSTLPLQAPPFDKISSDYQPAIEAGTAQQQKR
jgi:peptidyl-dipeptidase Dcp